MASGVDWLVSVGHPRTGVSPSDSPYLGLTKGGESIAFTCSTKSSCATRNLRYYSITRLVCITLARLLERDSDRNSILSYFYEGAMFHDMGLTVGA
jgi:hypothetical protein